MAGLATFLSRIGRTSGSGDTNCANSKGNIQGTPRRPSNRPSLSGRRTDGDDLTADTATLSPGPVEDAAAESFVQMTLRNVIMERPHVIATLEAATNVLLKPEQFIAS
jgi:hypothetical protein